MQATAVENRLQQRGADRQYRGRRIEEIEQHIAGESSRTRQRDAGQQRGACRSDIRVGGGKLGFGAGKIGPSYQQLRRQPGGHARHGQTGKSQGRRVEAFRRSPEEDCQREQRLAFLQFQRRENGLYRQDRRLLPREVERRSGAVAHARVHDLEHTLGDVQIFACDRETAA